jgi:hypothetical protein
MSGAPPEPAPRPWWHRLLNQLGVARRPAVDGDGGRDCCWYHGGDWGLVTGAAVRLIAQVEASGVNEDHELHVQVMAAARAEGLSAWSIEALYSLLTEPIAIHEASDIDEAQITNGQHRTHAMRDASLAAVLVGVEEQVERDEVGNESPA